MRTFGREPALILGLIAAVVKLLGYELDVSAGVQTAINATAAAVVGLVLAIVARNGAVAAAILHLAQTLMALFVGLGLNWSADRQALVMAAVAAGLALYEKTQTEPPIGPLPIERKSPLSQPSGPTSV